MLRKLLWNNTSNLFQPQMLLQKFCVYLQVMLKMTYFYSFSSVFMAIFHNHNYFWWTTLSLLSHLTNTSASAAWNLMLKSKDVLSPVRNNWHAHLFTLSRRRLESPLWFSFSLSTFSVWLWHQELETQVRVIFISHVVWLKAGGSLLKAAGWETVGRPREAYSKTHSG